METKIQIKTKFGQLIFEHEKENNTLADTLMEALRSGVKNFYGADFYGADFYGADFCGADFYGADFYGADFCDADFYGANFRGADFYGADFRGADFRHANFRGADFCHAQYNSYTSFLFPQCPSEGSFIGWKKAGGKIVKLRITEDAKRSSATTLKCRASKAEVLEIQELDGRKSDVEVVSSDYNGRFKYVVGSTVEVPDFDNNRWNECSKGIHFFISREVAVKYE